jgi:predicted transposase/invertase (TIGR01784 family)
LDRPKALQERVFTKLFEQAEIAKYTPVERREYEASVKDYWDYYSTMKTANLKGRAEGLAEGIEKGRAEGRAEGLEQGRTEGRAEGLEQGRTEGLEQGRAERTLEIARSMKALGMPDDAIVKATGLSAEMVSSIS